MSQKVRESIKKFEGPNTCGRGSFLTFLQCKFTIQFVGLGSRLLGVFDTETTFLPGTLIVGEMVDVIGFNNDKIFIVTITLT